MEKLVDLKKSERKRNHFQLNSLSGLSQSPSITHHTLNLSTGTEDHNSEFG